MEAKETKSDKVTDYFIYFNETDKNDSDLIKYAYREEANKRIYLAGKRHRTADTFKQILYAVLELCEENDILLKRIEKNLERIQILEARQKKINDMLQKVLERVKEYSLEDMEG
ncbi:MAG: hypothetical protein K5838_02650 [Elusimicrobiales bacterium]|nr:hypothetical protein [Elusimicrobiales bacterium]